MDASQQVFGRGPDVVLRKQAQAGAPSTWMRLWLAPIRFEGRAVFLVQVGRPVGGRFVPRDAKDIVLHEDVDEARNLLIQDMMYSGGLDKLGFATGVGPASPTQPRTTLGGARYHTDGLRAVLFLATRPLSLSDVEFLDWAPYLEVPRARRTQREATDESHSYPLWLSSRRSSHSAACATKPLVPYSVDTPPLALVPASQAGVQDKRGRFREIYCAVLEARERDVPDYRPCEDALNRIGSEPAGTGKPVDLGPSKRRLIAAVVAGIGYECFEKWLQPPGTAAKHVRQFGYDMTLLKVDALSSSANNARQIRDAIMAMPAEAGAPRLVLIGYSKGAPDILEAVVAYPEIRRRVAAVVSAAGAIGGSALANDAEQYQADLLRHFPGATCSSGDGGRREQPAARNTPGRGSPGIRCLASCATTRSSLSRSQTASRRF